MARLVRGWQRGGRPAWPTREGAEPGCPDRRRLVVHTSGEVPTRLGLPVQGLLRFECGDQRLPPLATNPRLASRDLHKSGSWHRGNRCRPTRHVSRQRLEAPRGDRSRGRTETFRLRRAKTQSRAPSRGSSRRRAGRASRRVQPPSDQAGASERSRVARTGLPARHKYRARSVMPPRLLNLRDRVLGRLWRESRRAELKRSMGLIEAARFTYFDEPPTVRSYPGDDGKVRIGSFCSIARDVEFLVGGNHRSDWVSTFPFRITFGLPGALEDGHPASRGDIVVGHDVWIGAGATLLSGVTVGNGAVIGARSVVARDVEPYAVVVGNPARRVRLRFEPVQIEALQDLCWWDWPLEEIERVIPLLSSSDIDGLLASRAGSGKLD